MQAPAPLPMMLDSWCDPERSPNAHSAIDYVAPLDKLEGRAEAIWTERDRKLAEARRPNEPQELLTT